MAACGDDNSNNNQNNQQQQNNNNNNSTNDEATAETMLNLSCLNVASGSICSTISVNGVTNHYIVSCLDEKMSNNQKCPAKEKCFKDEGLPYCSENRNFPFDTTGLCDNSADLVCQHTDAQDYLVKCKDGKVSNFFNCTPPKVCRFDSQKNKNQCLDADANSDAASDNDADTDNSADN